MEFPRAPLPRMTRVRLNLPDDHLPNVAAAVRDELRRREKNNAVYRRG